MTSPKKGGVRLLLDNDDGGTALVYPRDVTLAGSQLELLGEEG